MIFSIRHLPDVIPIGVQTETGVEPIGFDLRPWLEAYDGINVTVWPTRPGENAAYPAAKTELVGTILYWSPDAIDTAKAGSGTVELLGLTGDKRKLSGICKTEIEASSLGSTQEPPEAARPWVDEVLGAADRAEEQANRAKEIADGLIFAELSGAVRYDQEQTLTEDQKALARQNIGAGTGDGSGEAVEVDKTLTMEGAAADAKAVGDKVTALSEEIAKLPTGGGGSAIIDVAALPETDIDESVFYRLVTGTFYIDGTPYTQWDCHVVDALPDTGEPATNVDMSALVMYYNTADGTLNGYLTAELAAASGLTAGWYPAEVLFQVAGVGYGGAVTDIENASDPTLVYLLLEYVIYQRKSGVWTALRGIGWAGDGNAAEVFNSLKNIAKGECSHAEGYMTNAEGRNSHAEGSENYASGVNSHAEGMQTGAYGDCSHAEGNMTEARGNDAHAEGRCAIAKGDGSHAEGYYTAASSAYQHVQGKWNIEDSSGKYAHIVGNGEQGTPSNAHTLDWDGNSWFAGGIELTSPNGTRYRFTVSDGGTLTATVVTA